MTSLSSTQTWHYLEKWAAAQPDAEAIVFEDIRMTWQDLKQAVDETAAALSTVVQPGECVAMLAMARPEFLVTYLAAHKIGAVWLGLSPKYRFEELHGMLADCRPVALITLSQYQQDDLSVLVQALGQSLDCLKTILTIGDTIPDTMAYADFVKTQAAKGQAEAARRTAVGRHDDDALLIYTSGSTGKPKGVMHTHRSLLTSVAVQVQKWGMDRNTRLLLHFPINHAAASVAIGLAALVAGGCQVMMDRFDPVESLKMVERERLTIFGQAPAMFMLQLDHPLFHENTFATVRRFIWAGARAPLQLVERIAAICAKTGAGMLTGYGASETCGWITYTDPDADFAVLSKSAGRIAPPFELKVVDAAGGCVATGGIGEIWVRGPFLMRHYLNSPEATAAALDGDGWYHTGDLARQDTAGNIYITGRTNEMYKSGGEVVYPREIELVLESDPSVLMAVVVNVADPVYQQVGWAYVMPEPGHALDTEHLLRLCRDRLANFKVPKQLMVRDSLPMLANGKIDRRQLKANAQAGADGDHHP